MSLATFPGYGPDAPLDLDGLSDRALAGMAARLADGTASVFADALVQARGCSRPVRLVGRSVTIDPTTGEVMGEFTSDGQPFETLWRPCGNRRSDVCPACSRLYARDTFEVIRTGVMGGKGVPESVAAAPLVFATLTAPSAGHVHRADDARCRPAGHGLCPHGRPRWCAATHADTDPAVGTPICRRCYDHTSAVVWQWWAPELWRRLTITLRRHLATTLGVPASRLGEVAKVQFAKVAEYQARALIHFHALIRVDGPTGPGSPAPIDGTGLARLVRDAVPTVTFTAPPVDQHDTTRTLRFGAQTDVRVVRPGRVNADDLTGEAVAGYLAKYATKSATTSGTMTPALAAMADHARTLAARARRHDPDTPYLLLGKWAHMAGFRGHFSTRSRAYSVTLGALRRARRRFAALRATGDPRLDSRDLEALLLADDEETTLVISQWAYAGTGWHNDGDKALADAAATRAREYAQWKAQRPETTT